MQVQKNVSQIYWKKWIKDRDIDAGDALMRIYMPLVHFHVNRIVHRLPSSVSREDLHSLAMMGLYDALEKFDPKRDLKFETYASIRISGNILDGLRKEDWLPRSIRDKAKKIECAIEKLEPALERKATPEEIAHYTGYSSIEVVNVINDVFFSNMLSVDEQIKDVGEGQVNLIHTLKDHETLTPEELVLKDEQIKLLANTIGSELNEKEQLVISLYYHEELTLTEIGTIINLSTSRVSQIHAKSIFKLRHLLSNSNI
ncbi:FliA/WhiG family RNA polymerase sigma factor [Bacillus sp. AFS055030]|uniref:FliA/WhiG family RNA polymerase sigma factor n=1 Tax=Bacillus sp. AFS055030 TaxID=2033507 RepID=UPI000BFE77C5|nr:FliA/WhiG family RNA polymerase sigma factor [Bacillus sp. AFS055030]PGL68006.1 FliA/WhiG family RNA polymerase sigma factor [Bacillus sp. AFS055030]